MKKNITINLFGQLYHIDEDAYELLRDYEENMQRYFSRQEGGNEIIDDIEHRVAELLTELKNQGNNAICIEHIQEIIRRIGNPEEISEESETVEETGEQTCPPPPPGNNASARTNYGSSRRLFRDLKDSMLGGVSSGLSHYLGLSDPVFIRLAWVLLLFFPYFPSLVAYLILWIIIPPALTPEQRLMMYGKPVNPKNMNEEIIHSAQTKSEDTTKGKQSTAHQVLSTVLSVCAFAIKGIAIIFLVLFAAIAFLAILALLLFTLGTPFHWGHHLLDPTISTCINACYAHNWQLWLLLFTGVITLGLPLYLLIRRMSDHTHPTSGTTKRSAYIITWIIALLTSILLAVSISVNVEDEIEEQKRLDCTRDGLYLQGRSWNILDAANWDITGVENVHPRIYDYCDNLFRENGELAYISISAADRHLPMQCTIHRTQDLPEGYYQLEAIARSGSDGCFLFAKSPHSSEVQLTPVPFAGKPAMKLEYMSWAQSQQTHYFLHATDSTGWERVRKNSRKKKMNWYFVSSEPFHHDGGKLQYGMSNNTRLTHRSSDGKNFKFYDISITEVPSPEKK